MGDGRYRGRSPPWGARRGSRDEPMEYRSPYDRPSRPSRHSRSPERDRGARGQHYPDSQYGIPGENNYRPRYLSPPPARRDERQKSKDSAALTSTTENRHPDKAKLVAMNGDLTKRTQPTASLDHEDSEVAIADKAACEPVATVVQPLVAGVVTSASKQWERDRLQAKLDRREAEYRSSEGIHEKFPATAEAQTRSKNQAAEELKTATEELSAANSSLNDLMAKAVVDISKAVSISQHQDLQGRIERLEKTGEESQRLQDRVDVLEWELEEAKRREESQLKVLEESKRREESQQKVLEKLSRSQEDQSKLLEALQTQLDSQKSAVDNRLNAQRHDHDVLKTTQTRLSIEHESTKSLVNTVKSNNIPALEAYIANLSRDHHTAKETMAGLQEQVPRNLRSRLEQLTHLPDQVASVRVAVDKVKEDSLKSVDLDKKVETIEQKLNGHHDMISNLHRTVADTGSSNLAGLSASVTELLSAVELLKRHENERIGNESLKKVEEQLSVSVSDLRGDVARLDSRLRGVEERSPPIPSIPSFDSTKQAKLEASETAKKILALDRKVGELSSQVAGIATESSTATKYEIFGSLKKELLEVIEEKQSASDNWIDGLASKLESQATSDRNRLSAAEVHMATMDKALPKLIERGAEVLVAQNVKQEVGEAIKGQRESMTTAIMKLVTEAIHNAVEPLNDRVDGIVVAINTLEMRYNNINTKELAMFMISNLEAAYPDVRNVQDVLSHCKTQLAHYQGEVIRIAKVVDGIQQTQAAQGSAGDKSTQILRGEVDRLTLDLGKVKGTMDEVRRQRDADQAMNNNRWQQMAKEPSTHTSHPALPRSTSASVLPGRSVSNRVGCSQLAGNNKRRRLNGLHSDVAEAQTTKAPQPSRRRKRHTLGLDNEYEDSSDDSTFEPNQPTISDDDGES